MSDKLLFYWIIKFNKLWRAFKILNNTFPQTELVDAKSIVIVNIRFLRLRVGVFNHIDIKQKVVLENDCFFLAALLTDKAESSNLISRYSRFSLTLLTNKQIVCAYKLSVHSESEVFPTVNCLQNFV